MRGGVCLLESLTVHPSKPLACSAAALRIAKPSHVMCPGSFSISVESAHLTCLWPG